MSLQVSTKWSNQLADDELEHLDMERDEVSSWDFDTYLIGRHNGEILFVESDGGEPEDMNFGRDLSWIPSAIEDAYQRGRQDGVYEGGC